MKAYWNLEHSPITFDVVTFLAMCYQYMQYRRLTRWDLVVISKRKYRTQSEKDLLLTSEEKDWRLENIIVGLRSCIKCLNGFEIYNKEPEIIHTDCFPRSFSMQTKGSLYAPRFVVDAYNNAKLCPRVIEAPTGATRYSNRIVKPGVDYITFTQRESKFQPKRNTQMETFAALSDELIKKGIKTILFPEVEFDDFDTNNKWENSFSYVLPQASLKLPLRIALCSRALTNVSTGGGPAHCLWYSDIPFISTLTPIPEYKQTHSGERFKNWHGIEDNSQYPWFSNKQKFIHGDEKYEPLLNYINETIELTP